MRTLKFIIDGQILKQDPSCDFSGIVPGTEGYLQAEFSFSKEWNNTVKVAAFYKYGKECAPQELKDGKSCTIPAEALTGRKFGIKLLGINKEIKLTTNMLEVVQKGG